MGYEEIENIRYVVLRNISAGWFPNRQHNEIPGDLDKVETEVGSSDCNAVIWYEGSLRRMFGHSAVQSSALNGGAVCTSIYYSSVLDKTVGTVGNKIYSDVDTATPTDITTTLIVTPVYKVDWDQWQFEATSYVIGTNGIDPAWKWTGVGNASLLGGTPPYGKYVAIWNNACWLACTPTEPSTIFFSDLADPEVWTTNNDYKFDAPITGVDQLGDKLVVFKENSIGILSGGNNLELTKVDKYIDGIGCSSGYTIVHTRILGQEVLFFHSNDGWYAFDGSQSLTKLTYPLQRKYISGTAAERWNSSRFSEACAAFIPKYNWVMSCLTDGGASQNDFMVIHDAGRILTGSEGTYIPSWPFDFGSYVNGNCIACVGKNQDIIMGAYNGKYYKFDQSTWTLGGASNTYNSYFESKVFDAIQDMVLQEVNVIGDNQNASIKFYISTDLDISDGDYGVANFNEGYDYLDTTFIMDTSALGGKEFVFSNATLSAFGRFIKFKIDNNQTATGFNIDEINMVFVKIGLLSNMTEVST